MCSVEHFTDLQTLDYLASTSNSVHNNEQNQSTNIVQTDQHLPICQSYSDINDWMDEDVGENSRCKRWLNGCFLRWFHWYTYGFQDELTHSGQDKKKEQLWCLNYLEASIYLEEGLNNDKFEHHPHLFSKLPMYMMTHNRLAYALDLFASWWLLSLALAEKPAVYGYHLPEAVHASFELLALTIIGVINLFKIQWMGVWKFMKHGRSLVKTIVLCLMIIEAIVVLWRQDSHFRVTRSLRPVFLIDNYYFFGVRRVIRQTFQSLRSFVDMLALLLFFLIFFSISAFYLFSSIENYNQFSSMGQSFLSLFVLLTAANFPDVMMPAYKESQIYAMFFIAFLIINLYLLLNIMLAMVYNAFSQIEKQKFRKLFLHRRKACGHAFRLLVSQANMEYIQYEHFSGLMAHLRPQSTHTERFLMYKALVMQVFTEAEHGKHSRLASRSNSFSSAADGKMNADNYLKQIIENKQQRRRFNQKHVLTLDKFYHIYDVLNLKWTNLDHSTPWFHSKQCFGLWFSGFMYKLRSIVLHGYFELVCYLVIIIAAIYQLIDAIYGWPQGHTNKAIDLSPWRQSISAIFISIYSLEMIMKMMALGIRSYLSRRWNCFDSIVTMISLFAFLINRYWSLYSIESGLPLSTSFYSFRSLKLLDLLRHQVSSYRDVLGPFALIIMKRFMSVSLVVFIVYYFFAIIAMECFGQYSLKDCCVNSTVEIYYRTNGTSSSFYYLNNFQDLISSYITLFELMVVNNWQICMQAYVMVSGTAYTYVFFIVFYIITLVVVTIVLSFVLDTFNFHIEYKQRFGPDDSMSVKICIEVPLTQQEYQFYRSIDEESKRQKHSCYGFNLLGICSTRQPTSISTLKDSDRLHIEQQLGWPTIINENDMETIVAIPADERFMQGPAEVIASLDASTANSNKRTILFRGEKIRDKFSYNLRMFHDQLDKWIEQSQFS